MHELVIKYIYVDILKFPHVWEHPQHGCNTTEYVTTLFYNELDLNISTISSDYCRHIRLEYIVSRLLGQRVVVHVWRIVTMNIHPTTAAVQSSMVYQVIIQLNKTRLWLTDQKNIDMTPYSKCKHDGDYHRVWIHLWHCVLLRSFVY